MSRIIPVCFLALAATCASTVLASAQVTSSLTEAGNTASSPVAYIYIASYSSSLGKDQVYGYSAASNGALAAIPGSPFRYNVGSLALNGAWLFGVDVASQGNFIDSFSISAAGQISLKDKTTVNDSGGSAYDLFLDHTGSTLYSDYYTTNNDYLSYSIDQSTGALSYVNILNGGPPNNSAMSFIGNDEYAYSSSCYHFSPEIFGVHRNSSDGSLTWLNSIAPFPAEKNGGFYCPWGAAADPANHLAVALSPLTSNWGNDGPTQLAVYTVDSAGDLTTTSTWENMPTVLVASGISYAPTYWMSPSGNYLAVGGTGGLQIFHFNGANPITKFTGVLTTSSIDQVYWDNANHLYAISYSASKLFVFTVTSKSVTQAPGSPHKIASPESLIVLPK